MVSLMSEEAMGFSGIESIKSDNPCTPIKISIFNITSKSFFKKHLFQSVSGIYHRLFTQGEEWIFLEHFGTVSIGQHF